MCWLFNSHLQFVDAYSNYKYLKINNASNEETKKKERKKLKDPVQNTNVDRPIQFT